MYAMFERFDIRMSLADAQAVSHPGDCTADVQTLVRQPKIARQLDKIGPQHIREELAEYGAWDEEDLADDDDNRERIVWIAGGQILDDVRERS